LYHCKKIVAHLPPSSAETLAIAVSVSGSWRTAGSNANKGYFIAQNGVCGEN
jgi:hypothetical protein